MAAGSGALAAVRAKLRSSWKAQRLGAVWGSQQEEGRAGCMAAAENRVWAGAPPLTRWRGCEAVQPTGTSSYSGAEPELATAASAVFLSVFKPVNAVLK